MEKIKEENGSSGEEVERNTTTILRGVGSLRSPKQKNKSELFSTTPAVDTFEKYIVTLKGSGRQIEIFVNEINKTKDCWVLNGFISTPLIVEKKIFIVPDEIAAIEVVKDPNIIWTVKEDERKRA